MQTDAFPYLNDHFDKAVCGVTPTLMAPIRGRLEPPDLGGYRFVAASRGIYAEARSEAVEARILKAAMRFPYGDVEEGIRLVHGPIPCGLLSLARLQGYRSSPGEWAGLIVWNGINNRYEMSVPDVVSSSDSHVSYRDALPDGCELVVDLHSHGDDDAFFSRDDDLSDGNGIYIAGVMGKCSSMIGQTLVFRMVIHGQFFPAKLVCKDDMFWFGIN